MKRVYSVTICGKNDCVTMTEAEASMLAMKYGKHLAMYDMTKRHGVSQNFYTKNYVVNNVNGVVLVLAKELR